MKKFRNQPVYRRGPVIKFGLKMKLSLILVLGVFFQMQAETGFGQENRISLDLKSASILQVIEAIESNTEYRFFYSREELDFRGKVNIHARKEKIETILQEIFETSDIAYQVLGRQIILTRKPPERLEPINVKKLDRLSSLKFSVEDLAFPLLMVTGTVTDRDGEPLIGVNIQVKGTTRGTTTDFNGRFELQNVDENAVLVISYIGYQTQEIKVESRREINIRMLEDAETLDELVVVGYGTVKKSNLTSAIASISSNELRELEGNSRLDEALKGRIAGVQVQQTTGHPGGAPYIRIRGVSTLTSGNDPLWVIDGLPTTNTTIIRNLDLSNIESMDVLKGVAATSIYGSRGANGVIIVNTNKGKAGATQFNVSIEQGWSQEEKRIDMLTGPENVEFIKVARDNAWVDAGGSLDENMSNRPTSMQYPAEWNNPGYDAPNYDYQDFLFQTGGLTNVSMSAQGGSDFGTFFVSGSYLDKDGVVKRTNFKRYSLRTNLNLNITDFMSLDVNLNPSHSLNSMPGVAGQGGIIHRVALSTPYVFSPMSGIPGSGIPEITEGYFATPTFGLAVPNFLWLESSQVQDQIIGSSSLSINILSELKYKARGSYAFMGTENKEFSPLILSSINNNLPSGNLGENKIKDYIFDQTLTYDKIFSEVHNLSFMLGHSVEFHEIFSSNINGSNFPDDLVKTLNAAEDINASSSRSEWALISYMSRINYSFKDKYLFNFNIRRDGASRFGAKNRWGWFPSISAGWKISNESFFKSNVISGLKLRASYGIAGNHQIGNYSHIPTMARANVSFGITETLSSGYFPSNLGNEFLNWEKLNSINVGIDAGLFQDRVQLSFDAYRNITTDLLLNVELPAHTGFSNQLMNIGKVLNHGFEAQLTSYNITNQNFDWSTDLSLSLNENEVIALGPNDAPILSGPGWGQANYTQVGHPIGSFYLLEQIGVWNTWEEIDENPHWEGARPGNKRILDWNGDGLVNLDDRHLMGRSTPLYLIGLRNRIAYKNFDLSFFLNAAGGHNIVGALGMRAGGSSGQSHTAHLGYWRDFWKGPDNPGNPSWVPQPNDNLTGASGLLSDKQGFFDASYIRLKNITIGYTLPNPLTEKFKLSNVRLSLKGVNVWLYDNALYIYNVEGQTTNTGNALVGGGFDYASYPLPKQFLINLNVSF